MCSIVAILNYQRATTQKTAEDHRAASKLKRDDPCEILRNCRTASNCPSFWRRISISTLTTCPWSMMGTTGKRARHEQFPWVVIYQNRVQKTTTNKHQEPSTTINNQHNHRPQNGSSKPSPEGEIWEILGAVLSFWPQRPPPNKLLQPTKECQCPGRHSQSCFQSPGQNKTKLNWLGDFLRKFSTGTPCNMFSPWIASFDFSPDKITVHQLIGWRENLQDRRG